MSEKQQHSTQDPPPAIQAQQEHALGAAAAAVQDDPYDPIQHHHHRHRPLQDTQPVEDIPPPPYDADSYGHIDINQNGLDTGARVADDGRVNIKINEKGRRVRDILAPMLARQMTVPSKDEAEPDVPEGLGDIDGLPPPTMNIVIQIVGSRGDVQPFIALGQVLKKKYNHRVRIATHPTFRQFVTDNDLEFFSIGGDPAELMAFMVKNPGLMPGMESVRAGDIGRRRKTIYEMINGCWRSCIEAGDGTGVSASDELLESRSIDSGVSFGDDLNKPFVADAVIANPVSFAHIHVAEKLGIPLHLMFTMPWSPTQAFPHPLANILSSNTDQSLANYISYVLVDMLTWQGLGDLINKFRERVLHLEPVSIIWAPGMLARMHIPWTYCWSPALIPKPKDWNNKIDISGFFFLNLATNYTPAPDLAAFLEAGPPPVYIGFGSIVVDDPNAMTKMIFEAVKKTGRRALVSKGWGGLGADQLGIPEGVFMLGNVPHDWLFKKVACVVHHGGAGTTAAGIAAGRPTVVVPFFGDQPFWGAMTAKAGAGPMPIAYKELTSDKLADAIKEALKPASLERAAELSAKIKEETGAVTGAESFHKQIAVWRVRRTDIRLSALAATVLGNAGLLNFEDLKLYRPCEYHVDQGPPEPIIGGAAALIGTLSEMGAGVADMPVEILKAMKFGEYKKKDMGNPPDTNTPSESLAPPPQSARHSRSPSISDSKREQLDNVSETEDPTDSGYTSPSVQSPVPQIVQPQSMSAVFSPDGTPKRRWSLSRSPSRSRSESRDDRKDTIRDCSPSKSEMKQMGLESILGATKAGGHIVKAGLKSPMDFTMSLAQGFHNAPKLYGDKTVRKPARVTDFQSGLRAAGKEFGYGFYDGITGLVTQPIKGAREEGFAGLAKGAVRGAFGLVLKPGAAIWGLPGYSFKGIYMELTKHFGSSTQNYIIAARTAQGYDEWKVSSAGDRERIIAAWKGSKLKTKRGKQKYGQERMNEIESHILEPTPSHEHKQLVSGFKHTKNLSFDERKELDKRRQKLKKAEKDKTTPQKRGSLLGYRHVPGDPRDAGPPVHRSSADLLSAQEADFEEAIARSVSQTSRGNPQEDAVIERALRASVKALQNNPEPVTDDNEEEIFQRAVQASVEEAERARRELTSQVTGSTQSPFDEHEDRAILERALSQSLEDHHGGGRRIGMVDNDLDTDEDEEYRLALEASRQEADHAGSKQRPVPPILADSVKTTSTKYDDNDENDEELLKAMTLSEQEGKEREAALAKQRTEEDIVMEYIKKQSLLEEEHRQKMQRQ
ncbi:hypothetical protein LTR64_002003 [Lithohypha guttulata]|uniref:uncharacterized protein n=1 Tax=Lithohypha guttulata TaxID=1690604 RepID=UPI002DDF1C24|nr:hypothetical protein LTR51_007862 [Lithohypha guttulata]